MIGVKQQDTKAELARAKKADLVTLAPDVTGTNCANCEYVRPGEDYCDHPKVDQHLPAPAARSCCALWDRPGTKRAWEKIGVRPGD